MPLLNNETTSTTSTILIDKLADWLMTQALEKHLA